MRLPAFRPIPDRVRIMALLRPRHFSLVLCLCVLASFGCAKKEPTKEELLSRARSELAANHYREAESDYRQVLRLAPADPVATRELGLISYTQGELPQAYAFLKRAAEQQPEDLDIRVKLAQLHLWARQIHDARDSALAILEKHPGNEDILELLPATVT